VQQEEIIESLVIKLEELRWHVDVSRLIYRWQTGKLQVPVVPKSGLAVSEKVDQKKLAEAEAQAQPSTPRSPDSDGGVRLTGLNDVHLESHLDISEDDDLSVDSDADFLMKTDRLSVNSAKQCSESPVPASVWSDLLGEEGESADLDTNKGRRG